MSDTTKLQAAQDAMHAAYASGALNAQTRHYDAMVAGVEALKAQGLPPCRQTALAILRVAWKAHQQQ